MDKNIDPTLANELAQGTPAQQVDLLFAYMVENGQAYYDESVTQLQHALQAANQARRAAADPLQVTAALLHDLGHFLIDEHSEDADFRTEDFFHEEAGAEYLQPFFSAAVTEAMKLHVPAKRYICSTDDTYYNTLSEASKRSFALQGGFMSDEEKAEFEKNAYYKNAVQLRKWDDLAKEKELEVPGLENYREDVLGGLK